MVTNHHDRHVAIVLHGFTMSPKAVADAVDYDDVATLHAGDAIGRNVSSKNRITWRYPMFSDDNWDFAVNSLIGKLGGVDGLKAVIATTDTDAAWLRICLPCIGSPWQESAGLERKTLAHLVELGLDFDIAFFDYDADRATHGPRSNTLPA